MKMTKLLVLGALALLSSYSAFAADLVPREAPAAPEVAAYDEAALAGISKTPADYVAGNAYLLYNIGAQKYFLAGNDYDTRASLGPCTYNGVENEAVVVYFAATDAAKEKGEDVVELKNYVPKFSNFLSAFAGGVDDFWTDNDTRADRFWKVTVAADKSIRISNAVNETSKFVGWNGLETDYKLYLLAEGAENTEGGVAAIDWQLYAVPDWTSYLGEKAIYDMAEKLRKAIEDALAVKADVDAQIAVYNNQGSTMAELAAAIEAANKAADEARESGLGDAVKDASGKNPVDLTAYVLVNPNFDGDDLKTGWSGTEFGSYNPKENAEHYEKTYDTYQEISGLPAGVYALQVNAFYRAGNADPAYTNYKEKNANMNNAKLYAESDDETFVSSIVSPFTAGMTSKIGVGDESSVSDNGVTYYIPNNMEAADAYFNAGYYNNTVFFTTESGNIKIGVKKETTISGDWSIFDNFRLIYYGNDDDSYQAWVESILESAPNFDNLDDDDILYTEELLDDYQDAFDEMSDATTKDDIVAAEAKLLEAANALSANIEAWKNLQAAYKQAQSVAADPTLNPVQDDVMNLADEVMNVEDILDDHSLSTEEILEETALLNSLRELALANGMNTEESADVTDKFLTNADFSNGSTGWKGNWTNISAGCAEAYELNPFDMYQEVANAPVGVYEIQLQAFYRPGFFSDENYIAYLNAVQNGEKLSTSAQVYMNNNATDLNSVYDFAYPTGEVFDLSEDHLVGPAPWETTDPFGNAVWFANGMSTASDAFNNGDYQKSAYGLVAKKGDPLRVGIKGSLGSGSWAIWDNFRLIYHGMKADIIREVLTATVKEYEAKQNEKMPASVKESLTSALAAAKEAMAGEDGAAMFECLNDLYNVNEAIIESKEGYEKLATAVSGLEEAILNAPDAPDAAKASATALVNEVTQGIDNGAYANDEIADVIFKIGAAKTALLLPADVDQASQANPVEVTSVIANASYDNNNNTGWSGTTPAFGYTAAEVYNANFNIYQDIVGLPAGTYALEVNAFFRYSWAGTDYTTLDVEENNHAILYAAIGDDEATVPVKRLGSEATVVAADEEAPAGYTWADETARIAVSNNMESAENDFNEGKYINTLIVNVPANSTLRIGMKKEAANVDGSWTIFDNWRLTYYGYDPNGVQNVQSQATAGKTEYYNLNGARINKLQKGIVIVKEVQADGSVKVRKINVK